MYRLRDDVWRKHFDPRDAVCLECAEERFGREFTLDEFEWCPVTVYLLILQGRVTSHEAAMRGVVDLAEEAEHYRGNRMDSRLFLLTDHIRSAVLERVRRGL